MLQACSFILATPDTLKYTTLYDTLVGLLSITSQVDSSLRADIVRSAGANDETTTTPSAATAANAAATTTPATATTVASMAEIITTSATTPATVLSSGDTSTSSTAAKTSSTVVGSVATVTPPSTQKTVDGNSQQLSYLGHCAVQYNFSLVYRILLTLPPSVGALEALASPDAKLEGPWLLHALVWGPRASHKFFNGWIKDGLVRQSLTTQKADALLKSVTNVTSSLHHDLRVAGQVVTALVAKVHARAAGKSPILLLFLRYYLTPSLTSLFLSNTFVSS